MSLFKIPPKTKKLERRIADLENQLEVKSRTIAVLEAERDAMASVLARDRQRVLAESAEYARRRAESEGMTNERNFQSN